MKNLLSIFLLQLAVGAAFACSQISIENVGLQQEKWQKNSWTDYQFIVQRQCFCYVDYTREMRVDVSKGRVVKASYTDTEDAVAEDILADINTIDEWFAVIDDAYTRQADKLYVHFDEKVGSPAKIMIDMREDRSDDEQAVIISSIKKL